MYNTDLTFIPTAQRYLMI